MSPHQLLVHYIRGSSTNTDDPRVPQTNFPVQTYEELTHNPNFYPDPNAATDRYFRQEVYEKAVESDKDPSNQMLFKSLTGDAVQKKDIKFNNMVPFFGSNVTQRTCGYDGNESIPLDSYSGSGSQQIRKKAQGSSFQTTERHPLHTWSPHPHRLHSIQNEPI